MTEPRNLPVWQSRNQILEALKENQVIIVESPTGSGKTTQIPLILKEAGYSDFGVIGITQPRRIATLSVSSFISEQIKDENLSDKFCAYKMRFYDTTTEATRIKILTDGMLLQELKTDSLLSKYSVIMVDEAHERSLNIDFILGLLKQIIKQRKDLRIIISSATLNTNVFSKFFSINGKPAPIISIQTRQYNVDVRYYPLKHKGDFDEISHSICQIINTLLKRFKETDWIDNQDTLVFLPGEFEIKTTLNNIYEFCDYKHLQIYPLYGRLNKEEQEQVFEKTQQGKMKVVLATNIAETSLTIDGIKVVIDSGLSKINFYNQYDFTSSLVSRPISRSSAMQRTGRAGRTSDGVCYRLYGKEDFEGRSLYTQEEILRTDLSEVVLRMVDLGITDFENFPFVTKPEAKALRSGELTLQTLEAIDSQRHLTEIGKLMTAFPLLPRHSRCLVEAINKDPEIIRAVAICVSFLSCKTPFVLPPGEEDSARSCHRRFSSEYGDFIGYQYLFRKYYDLSADEKRIEFCNSNYLDKQSMDEIIHVADQLCDIVRELGIPLTTLKSYSTEEFVKRCLLCLSKGLIQYVCVNRQKSIYSTITTDEIFIHPGSAYFRNPPKYLLAGEIVLTTKMYARTVSPLKESWISEISPNLRQRLAKLSSNNKISKKTDEDKRISDKKAAKTASIYGFNFPVVQTSDKKSKSVVIIPSDVLPKLAKAYKMASRHPKSVNAAILFNGYYVHFGERLFDIVSLSRRVKFDPSRIVKNIERKIFFQDTIGDVIPYLNDLMKFSQLSKYHDRLGFIELVTTGKGIMLHVNASFDEAINNTAYCLLSIMDIDDRKEFVQTYNRIVRLLD